MDRKSKEYKLRVKEIAALLMKENAENVGYYFERMSATLKSDVLKEMTKDFKKNLKNS